MWRAWVRLCVGPCRYPRRRFCHPKDLQQNRSAHVTRCTEVCWGRNIWAPRETVVFQHGKEAASAWRNVLMGQELLTVVGFTSALLSKTFQVSRTCFGEVCCFVRYLDFKQVKVQNGLALTKASRLVRSGHLKNNRRNVWGAEGGGEERTEGRAEEDVKNTCVQCWLGWGTGDGASEMWHRLAVRTSREETWWEKRIEVREAEEEWGKEKPAPLPPPRLCSVQRQQAHNVIKMEVVRGLFSVPQRFFGPWSPLILRLTGLQNQAAKRHMKTEISS